MKIGIIQTRGLGDIVIAIPIAIHFIELGCEIVWPIDSDFLPSFTDAFPKVQFIAIDKKNTGKDTIEYFVNEPLNQLVHSKCDAYINLYSHLTGIDLGNPILSSCLTFDAYKYAIAKVPFKKKWDFHPRRNLIREAKLFTSLNLDPRDEYVVIHDEGSNFKANISEFVDEKNFRQVKIGPITDNIFDWLGVIENSCAIYTLDSVYMNLVEQMGFRNKKMAFLRTPAPFTPVMQNDWTYRTQ